MRYYWQVIRQSDGMELVAANTRRDCQDAIARNTFAGFVSPDDSVSIARVTIGRYCDDAHYDEDYVVRTGHCDICGLPVSL